MRFHNMGEKWNIDFKIQNGSNSNVSEIHANISKNQLLMTDPITEKDLLNDIVKAAPSTIPYVDEINNEILTGSLYKALKAAKKLIQYEQELLGNAE